MVAMDDVKPWDRQPGETSKAYAAFCVYRDQGQDRTVRTVAEALSRSDNLIKGWSSKNNWVARAAAWDSMPSRAVAEAYQDMAERIARQHEELATELMEKLRANVRLLKPGKDPTMSFSTALGAARQSHQFAADLSKPADTAKAEISKQIAAIIERLAGGED